ncbi:MAG: cyclopropane-fatty-acyl-phospholipid synthase [Acidimicrobiales bacterium]|nr:cyclopropane-fatty-acyl-phospholipid synthase [Acidimicrobiales bacterium]
MTTISLRHRREQSTPVAEDIATVARRFLGADAPISLRGWDGSTAGPPDAPVTIVVRSPRALRRLLWAPGELGLARAHVSGDLDIDGDVFALLGVRDHIAGPQEHVGLELGLRDIAVLARVAARVGAVGLPPPPPPEEARVGRSLRGRDRDAAEVSHHYDVGNDFYRLVLGPSMTYSCAYWPTEGMTLEQAQAAKHELVCRKLGLQPGMRLLDVGCGWGSMALHAARQHGVSVVGITLSQEQQRAAMQRVAEAGLGDRVEIRLQDYREVVDGPFDAISSIGMFEHVAVEQMKGYLRCLRDLLTPTGRLLNHAITRPDPSPGGNIAPRSFIGRYVFPGAALLEPGKVVSAMHGLGLEVRDVQSLREHYAATLRCWVANLQEHWEEAERLVGPGRARVWRLYMAGSAIGFEQHRTSIHQILAVRTTADGTAAMPANRAGFEVDPRAMAVPD